MLVTITVHLTQIMIVLKEEEIMEGVLLLLQPPQLLYWIVQMKNGVASAFVKGEK